MVGLLGAMVGWVVIFAADRCDKTAAICVSYAGGVGVGVLVMWLMRGGAQ